MAIFLTNKKNENTHTHKLSFISSLESSFLAGQSNAPSRFQRGDNFGSFDSAAVGGGAGKVNGSPLNQYLAGSTLWNQDSSATDPRAELCAVVLFGVGGGERQKVKCSIAPTMGMGKGTWGGVAEIPAQRLGLWNKVDFLPVWYLPEGSEACVSQCLYLLIYFILRWAQGSVLLTTPRDTQSMRMMWHGIYTGKRSWLSLDLLQPKRFSISIRKFTQWCQ